MFGTSRRQRRFSLLLLEEQEYYFQDYTAIWHSLPRELSETSGVVALNKRVAVQGRLHVCSHNVVFEPDEQHFPVFRLPFADMQRCDVRMYHKQVFVLCKCTRMVEVNSPSPYRPVSLDSTKSQSDIIFSLPHLKSAEEMDPPVPKLLALHSTEVAERKQRGRRRAQQRRQDQKKPTPDKKADKKGGRKGLFKSLKERLFSGGSSSSQPTREPVREEPPPAPEQKENGVTAAQKREQLIAGREDTLRFDTEWIEDFREKPLLDAGAVTTQVRDHLRLHGCPSSAPPPAGDSEKVEVHRRRVEAYIRDVLRLGRPTRATHSAWDRHLLWCARVTPFVEQPGFLLLTDHRIYVQPFSTLSSVATQKYHLKDVVFWFTRRYAMRDVGVELFFGGQDVVRKLADMRAQLDRMHGARSAQTRSEETKQTGKQGGQQLQQQEPLGGGDGAIIEGGQLFLDRIPSLYLVFKHWLIRDAFVQQLARGVGALTERNTDSGVSPSAPPHSEEQKPSAVMKGPAPLPPGVQLVIDQRAKSSSTLITVRAAYAMWSARLLCTYDYLLLLNFYAGRSFNDLTQYPVFPWVLQDFVSTSLDLSDPAVYRDLSKPVGALNPDRLSSFQARMREMPKDMCGGFPFLYGTHYSSPGYVLYYLVRARPEWMVRLQQGKFDHPDRLFHSVQGAWHSVTHAPMDVKELIPEFYSQGDLDQVARAVQAAGKGGGGSDSSLLTGGAGSSSGAPSTNTSTNASTTNNTNNTNNTNTSVSSSSSSSSVSSAGGLQGDCIGLDFLRNARRLELGRKQNGERVDDVVLPAWARGDPAVFGGVMRAALESPMVSESLHQWIDLIFGAKQTGEEAAKAHNLFYYLTYEDNVDIESVTDAVERESLLAQVHEFGQTPRQIFACMHPPRTPPPCDLPLLRPSGPQNAVEGSLDEVTVMGGVEHSSSGDGGVGVRSAQDTQQPDGQQQQQQQTSEGEDPMLISGSPNDPPPALQVSTRVSAPASSSTSSGVTGRQLLSRCVAQLQDSDGGGDDDGGGGGTEENDSSDGGGQGERKDLDKRILTMRSAGRLSLHSALVSDLFWVKSASQTPQGEQKEQQNPSDDSTSSTSSAASGCLVTVSWDSSLQMNRIRINGDSDRQEDTAQASSERAARLSKLRLSCCLPLPQLATPSASSSGANNSRTSGGTGSRGLVVAGGWGGYLHVFSPRRGGLIQKVWAHEDAVSCMSASYQSAHTLALVCPSSALHTQSLDSNSGSSSAHQLLTGSWDSSLKLWTCSPSGLRDTALMELVYHTDAISCVTFQRGTGGGGGGSLAASASVDGAVLLWDLRQQQLACELSRPALATGGGGGGFLGSDPLMMGGAPGLGGDLFGNSDGFDFGSDSLLMDGGSQGSAVTDLTFLGPHGVLAARHDGTVTLYDVRRFGRALGRSRMGRSTSVSAELTGPSSHPGSSGGLGGAGGMAGGHGSAGPGSSPAVCRWTLTQSGSGRQVRVGFEDLLDNRAAGADRTDLRNARESSTDPQTQSAVSVSCVRVLQRTGGRSDLLLGTEHGQVVQVGLPTSADDPQRWGLDVDGRDQVAFAVHGDPPQEQEQCGVLCMDLLPAHRQGQAAVLAVGVENQRDNLHMYTCRDAVAPQ